jgi:DNA repair protein RecN (Recombination protein N)
VLARAVKDGLLALAMPFATFEVQVDVGPLGPSGVDLVTFLFSANAGEPPRPLARVASGGEASRLLLAVKAALLDADDDGVSVFDEADAGVGGAVADSVGLLLKKLSGRRQVLCVTHLPQVAAWADQHLLVKKGVAKGRSRSRVEPLDAGEGRERELARMLSGAQVSREALGAARQLLKSARATRRTAPKTFKHQRIRSLALEKVLA